MFGQFFLQVNVHQKNTVSAVSNIVVISHRQNYNLLMRRLQNYQYELIPIGDQQRDMRQPRRGVLFRV